MRAIREKIPCHLVENNLADKHLVDLRTKKESKWRIECWPNDRVLAVGKMSLSRMFSANWRWTFTRYLFDKNSMSSCNIKLWMCICVTDQFDIIYILTLMWGGGNPFIMRYLTYEGCPKLNAADWSCSNFAKRPNLILGRFGAIFYFESRHPLSIIIQW
jgi:hypothetical protein